MLAVLTNVDSGSEAWPGLALGSNGSQITPNKERRCAHLFCSTCSPSGLLGGLRIHRQSRGALHSCAACLSNTKGSETEQSALSGKGTRYCLPPLPRTMKCNNFRHNEQPSFIRHACGHSPVPCASFLCAPFSLSTSSTTPTVFLLPPQSPVDPLDKHVCDTPCIRPSFDTASHDPHAISPTTTSSVADVARVPDPLAPLRRVPPTAFVCICPGRGHEREG